MRLLKLNDGTVIVVNRCGAFERVLWIGLQDIHTFIEAAQIFSDKTKTEKMICTNEQSQEVLEVYEGYTDLVIIQNQNGTIVVGLRKE